MPEAVNHIGTSLLGMVTTSSESYTLLQGWVCENKQCLQLDFLLEGQVKPSRQAASCLSTRTCVTGKLELTKYPADFL